MERRENRKNPEKKERPQKESEALLNDVGEMAKVGGWELDVKTRAVRWTKETYRIHDISEDEKFDLSKAVLFFDLPDRSTLEVALQRCMETGEPFDLELPFTSAKGRHLWTRAMGRAVKVGGKVVKLTGAFQDITERKRADAALKVSEHKYRTLVENIPEKIFVKDAFLAYVSCNDPYARDLGIAAEAIAGKTDFNFYPSDLAEKYRADDRAVMESGATRTIDERYVLNGVEFWVSTLKTPIRDDTGNISGILGIFHDITEKKRAEKALQENEIRFRTMADWTNDWEYWIDLNRKFIYLSPSVERITGHRPEEFMADPGMIDRIVHPDDRMVWDAHIPLHITTKETSPSEIEFRLIHKDGAVRWISHICRSIFLDDGSCIGRRVSNRDITERKRAEEAVRENEVRYRSLFEGAAEGILVADIDTKNFLHANPAMCRMLGYSEGELTTLGIEDIHPKESLDYVIGEFMAQARGEKLMSTNIPLLRKDKTILSADISTTHIFIDGKMRNVGFFSDITERKKAEDILKETKDYLTNLISYANAPIITWDPDFRITEFNHAFETLTGMSRQDVIGQPLEILFPEPSKKESMDRIRETSAGEQWEVVEIPIRHVSGETHIVLWNSANIVNPEGRIISTIAQGQDITDRKRTEDALRESEAKFRSLIENIPDVTWTTDRDGRTVFISSKVEAVYGFTPEEIYRGGDTIWLERIHPDDVKNVKEKFQAVFERQELFNIEYRIQRKDQSWIWLHDRAVATYEKDGKWYTDGIFADITDRKRAEETLRESEERYRTLAEASPDQIFIVGRDDTMKYANTASLKLFRLSYDQVIGKPRKNLFPPDIANSQEPSLQKVFETGESVRKEERIQFGKHELWIDTSLVPLKDGAGNVTSLLGVARDVTERRRAEEALRESERKFHMMADFTVDWEYWLAPDSSFVYISPSCEGITGYSPKEFIADPALITRIVHPDDAPLVSGHFSRIHKSPEPGILDFRIVGRNGETHWLAHTCKPVYDRSGTYLGRRASNRDITDRKRAEESLHESELRFRSVYEGAAEGILVADIETRKFLHVNPAMCRLLGYSEEELITLGVEDIHPKEQLDYVVSEFMALVRGEKTLAMNIPLLRKDKTILYADISTANIFIDGKMCNVGFFSDITERKKAEDTLKRFNVELEQQVTSRTAELNTSLKEKEVLLKEIHHRVRNNLQVVGSIINLQAKSVSDPASLQQIQEIRMRIGTLALVHEIAYLAKTPESINMRDFLNRCTSRVTDEFKCEPGRINITIAAENVQVALTQAVPCSLIVNELLMNSIRHAFPGNRHGEIRIGFSIANGDYTLEYSDDGVGFPERMHPDKAETGGLSLIQGLTRQIRGTVKSRTRPGTGYTLTFPAELREEVEAWEK